MDHEAALLYDLWVATRRKQSSYIFLRRDGTWNYTVSDVARGEQCTFGYTLSQLCDRVRPPESNITLAQERSPRARKFGQIVAVAALLSVEELVLYWDGDVWCTTSRSAYCGLDSIWQATHHLR